MALITFMKSIDPSRFGKVFYLGSAGELTKTASAKVLEAQAATLEISTTAELMTLLGFAAQRGDSALMLGSIHGALINEKFTITTRARLGKLLQVYPDQVPDGIVNIAGRKVAARTKKGTKPSAIILVDADNPIGMPVEQTDWDIQQRLEHLEPIIPGISTCERIEMRSSSARVHKDDALPGNASHAFIQVTDAAKIEPLREHLRVETQLSGRCFASPRRSRATGDIIGSDNRSVIDFGVLANGRVVFTAQANVLAPGYRVADPGIKLVNKDAGPLDLSSIKLPDEGRLERLRQLTGRSIRYTKGNGLAIRDEGSLTLDTEIEVKGKVRPLRERIRSMQPGDKVRCETPFRASQSEAAFIGLNKDREPYLYDSGTNTTYFLSLPERLKLGNLSDANLQALFPIKSGVATQPLVRGNSW